MRFEMMREGIQECEARIFIEEALADERLRGKLGEELTERCQTVLDERTRAMLRGVNSLIISGSWEDYSTLNTSWWWRPVHVGYQWYVVSDWQARSERLFSTAADVAQALGNRR